MPSVTLTSKIKSHLITMDGSTGLAEKQHELMEAVAKITPSGLCDLGYP